MAMMAEKWLWWLFFIMDANEKIFKDLHNVRSMRLRKCADMDE